MFVLPLIARGNKDRRFIVGHKGGCLGYSIPEILKWVCLLLMCVFMEGTPTYREICMCAVSIETSNIAVSVCNNKYIKKVVNRKNNIVFSCLLLCP